MQRFKEFLSEGKGDTEFHKYSKESLEELQKLLKHHEEDLKEYDAEDEGCDRASIEDDIEEIKIAIKAKKEVSEEVKVEEVEEISEADKTPADFVKEMTKLKNANKNKWYTFTGTIDGKNIQLKGYGTWLQIYKVDGIDYGNAMEASVKAFKEALIRPFED